MNIAARTQRIVAGLRTRVQEKLDRHTVDGLKWISVELVFNNNISDGMKPPIRGSMALVLPCSLKADAGIYTYLLELQLIGWLVLSIERLRSPAESDVKMDWVLAPKSTTPPTADLFPDLPSEQQPLPAGNSLTTDLEVKREA